MTTKEAVEQLTGFQSQIIHGSNTFGDLADHIEFLEKVAETRMESLNTVSAERDGAIIRERSLRDLLAKMDATARKSEWVASAQEFESWLETLQLPGADPLPLWVCEKMKTAWDASASRVAK